MGFTLKNKPVTQKLTRELAEQFVNMDPAPHDRPLSERRLMVYERLIGEGLFRPITWAKCYCTETGGVYRVNGKHTSILASRMENLPTLYITIEEYVCDTLKDVATLYSTFDSKMQSRSALDIYCSFAGTVDELKGIAGRILSLGVAGMSLALGLGVESAAERAELLLEHSPFVVWVNDIMKGKEQSTRSLRRYPVTAAMFSTYQRDGEAATKFWTAVRDETGPNPTLPDRVLARYLLTSGVIVSHGDRGAGKVVKKSGPREMYVKCLHAWNAWRAGESTRLHYYPDTPVPTVK